MDLRKPVLIMMALVGVLLTVLALQGTVAGEWTSVAEKISPLILIIGFLALVVALMLGRD